MKHESKSIKLTCDGCGQLFEFDGLCSFDGDEDGKFIEEVAENSNWIVAGNRHYCPDCHERDDNDLIITKDGRKWDDSGIELVEVTEE